MIDRSLNIPYGKLRYADNILIKYACYFSFCSVSRFGNFIHNCIDRLRYSIYDFSTDIHNNFIYFYSLSCPFFSSEIISYRIGYLLTNVICKLCAVNTALLIINDLIKCVYC